MRWKQVRYALLFLVCLAVAHPAMLHAQATNTGTVVGQVMDPSGAAIAGATVTMTDLSTKTPRTTSTNADGRYIFVNVPPGTYDFSMAATGFRTSKIAKETVSVGLQLTLNATLQLGTATEVIEVSAAPGAELQTMNSTVGTSFTGMALDSLPSISREASTFAMLQPGVTPEGSVAGAVFDQNTFQLDGAQNTNDMDGSMNIYTPSSAGDPTGGTITAIFTATGGGGPTGVMPTPIDSVEEFKVGTTQQTADFNSSAGAQVSMSTKRGTDSWHGTAYEYYLDNNWNANSFNNDFFGTPIPSYHYNRFGGAVGGPLVSKKVLGGKTYFFANYQGYRYPNSATVNREVPGPGLRQGLIDVGGVVYNLNPTATTYTGPSIGNLVSGTVYPSAITQAACGGVSCDPRNLGLSPTMSSLFALLPASNVAAGKCSFGGACDGINIQQFTGNVSLPQEDNFGVIRMDHEFSDKEHFFASYRYYKLTRATSNQTDLTTTGDILSTANRPQVPWFLVAGLTSNLSTNFTNDIHYNYLRNFWQWGDNGGSPQLPGLGAALEPGGENATAVLSPYNVNTQSIRTRYWDGQDNMFRDDMTRLAGNHVFQWGGTYQHNYNQHSRSDNGVGVNFYPTYQMATGSGGNGVDMTGFVPAAVPSATNWAKYYADVLGILAVDQVAYTRSGPQLTLNPPLTPIIDRVDIPYYNTYFTDSWHVKPTLTLTYGLAWTLEMPPYEQNGKQIELVDAANQLISAQSYFDTRKQEALLGQVYNPEIGFTLVRNAEGGLKYPYNPYYGSFSPRIGAAWNPNYDNGILGSIFGHGKSVIRGGFSIIYGRLNGVDLVLVPLLGTGLIQPVQCFNPLAAGGCGGQVPTGTPLTSFRVGPTAGGWDGLVAPLAAASPTLPQPDFPGINAAAAGQSEATDPNFRPNKSYEFDLTFQRQLSNKISLEAGYIGRIIRNEFQPINLNAVPYMFTVGGQSFAKAYGNLVMEYCGGFKGLAGGNCAGDTAAVTPQPFFEKALGGPTSAYCTGFTSCTAAVAANEGNAGTTNLSTQNVFSLWSDLDSGPYHLGDPANFTGPTMENTSGQLSSGVATNTSLGYGNYNALFVSLKTTDYHGLTAQSNFTYGKAMGLFAQVQASSGLTTVDPYDLSRGYGPQAFDRKFVNTTFLVYQAPYYKSQRGVMGHLLGGWSIAPIFVTGSGLPLTVSPSNVFLNGNFTTFGEGDAGGGYASSEQAVLAPGCSGNYSNSRRNGVAGTNGVGIGGPYSINLYANPSATYDCFRNPVLGIDTGDNGGAGNILRGQSFWNVDLQIRKTTHITERISGEFQIIFTDLFNHPEFLDPTNALGDTGDWGALESSYNTPRQFEFGFRIRF